MDRIRAGRARRGSATFVAWLLGATQGFGVKVVNPGGVETLEAGAGERRRRSTTSVDHFGVTPRQILTEIAAGRRRAGPAPPDAPPRPEPRACPATPRPPWRRSGPSTATGPTWPTSSSTATAASPATSAGSTRRSAPLADYVNAHPNLTVDVGQVIFGETTSMTADGAVGQFLHEVTGRKWVSHDVELETGCGVVPITYDDRNAVHALQWAIGLEWFLRVDDPWRVALSTDHPNGGSFLAYPQIIALLMDRGHRPTPSNAPARAGPGPVGPGRPRRASTPSPRSPSSPGPAPRGCSGWRDKGHLGPGADADVTIYAPDDDKERMFALPRYLIKAGEVVLDDGELRAWPEGRTLHVAPEVDPDGRPRDRRVVRGGPRRSRSPTTRSATRRWPTRRSSRSAGRGGRR